MFKIFENHFKRQEERKVFQESVARLLEEGSLNPRFIIFTALSAAIATLGIIMNNSSVIIGSMLIAPLLIPVIGLSVGVGSGSTRLILSSIKSLGAGLAISILVAYLIARSTLPIQLDPTLYASFSDSFLYSLVALFSGVLAVISWFSKKTDLIIPGVGIAVALMPPLALLGVIIAIQDTNYLTDIQQVLFVNLIGIFVGGFITFLIHMLFSQHSSEELGNQLEQEIDKQKKSS